MEIKYGSGLEFEVGDQAAKAGKRGKGSGTSPQGTDPSVALEQIIRHGYRAPVLTTDNITVTIGKMSYGVFNVASQGLGIFLPDDKVFAPGQVIRKMTVHFAGKKFVLSGRVVHVSQDEANYLCGIELLDMEKDCRKVFEGFLKNCKTKLFGSPEPEGMPAKKPKKG